MTEVRAGAGPEGELGRLRQAGYSATAFVEFGRATWVEARRTARANPGLAAELRLGRRVGIVLAALVGGGLALFGVQPATALAVPVGAAVALSMLAWAGLRLLRNPLTGAPVPAIGIANGLTLFRGWAAAPVLLLGLGRPGPSWPWFTFCLLAGTTDLVDGTIAGRRGQQTRLGSVLDPVMDALFFSAAALSLAHFGLFPPLVAVAVAVRYFAPVLGALAVMLATGRSIPVRHTPWGQASTAAIGVALTLNWARSIRPALGSISLVADGLALVTMALALLAILRLARERDVAVPAT